MFNKPIYTDSEPRLPRHRLKVVLIVLVILAVVGAIVAGYIYMDYRSKLEPVDTASTEPILFVVKKGDSVPRVATRLEEEGLIQDAQALRWYVKLENQEVTLREGAFEVSKNQSVPEIIDTLINGKIVRKVLTIVPAANMFDVEKRLVSAGYTEEAAAQALTEDFSGHAALTHKPPEASLEGYLYPDTYLAGYLQPPEVLIGLALDEMAKVLADEALLGGFEAQGLTPHEAVILASIVEQEASDEPTRKQVAQVFLKRLDEGISLGADPTFRYASELAGVPDSVSIDSPYNTRLYKGLPPGPIGAVSKISLQAVAFPAEGDYLYFVSGDDGNTYFSNTLEEHQANTRKYCVELCKL